MSNQLATSVREKLVIAYSGGLDGTAGIEETFLAIVLRKGA